MCLKNTSWKEKLVRVKFAGSTLGWGGKSDMNYRFLRARQGGDNGGAEKCRERCADVVGNHKKELWCVSGYHS